MSKTYCAKLWNHQYIHGSGSIRLCCATMDNIEDDKGNRCHINNHSLANVWNSKQMREVRIKMINNEQIPSCTKCYEQESRGYKSMRDTQDIEKNFALTKIDGSIDVMPRSMELHFGNTCNLKCKMCGQQYSNQIGKELLEIGEQDPDFLSWVYKESGNVNIWTNNLSVEYKWFKNTKTKNKLFDHLTLIGGEPTIIPEFWEMFDYLDQKSKLQDLSITLTTNLTNTNPKLARWLPKLKEWTIWASVDGVGERTEYIRYPSNFNKVCENLAFYKNLIGDNGRITLSPAIQLLNIDQLDDILDWWLGFTGGRIDKQFSISWMAQVWFPTICNYDILPADYKSNVAQKLKTARHKFVGHKQILKFYDNQIYNLENDVCKIKDREHFQKAFVRYNDTQDRFRGRKTWRELLPQLEKALTHLNEQGIIDKNENS